MKNNTNISERISQMIESVDVTPNEFAKKLGYNRSQVIYDIINGKSKPSFDFFEKLENSEYSERFNLNWLISGGGSMKKITKIDSTSDVDFVFETKSDYNKVPQIVTVDSNDKDNIVLVPQALKAGYLEGFDNKKFISKLPTYRMPGLNNGVFRMFPVEGNSMFPTLTNNSYVVGQFVDNWITGIKDNRLYIIISNQLEDGLVKRCINRIEKYNNLICKSDNRRNYPNQNIDPSTIKEVWEVKLHLNFDLPDPGDLYDRMNDLEAEMQEMKRKLIN
ncbi:LexA family transcriptional regulator [Epilithonimonas arachidiradicis]|uniref:Phage repressor protein C with HTH and peptisase S24 domain n=1 Tax=Epilithonimonas arachidiradicis TaxID=1617282 RepID=A0A420DDP0_9FLAO|nr:transcriptional regulator [Epilithonimonas arachidiradicis]RKE90048.1 phage repressor protein C with HTH and peptisase S24 domain [Epilithonimonas arachidiradicis]GGG47318.1 hypothetical protein GCM10007332_06050 [Epilithonimonas arachidiradicis]